MWRYGIDATAGSVRQVYGESDPVAAASFEEVIEREKPDLVHLHAFTRGVSLEMVRKAKDRGCTVVFTYHTPTVSCQRGTLLRWGRMVCDGEVRVHRCARCALHDKGMSRVASTIVGSLPPTVGETLDDVGLQGGVWTGLRMTELIALRKRAFYALMDEVDHVVAVCDWVKEVLHRNGVPSHKITVSRQGLSQQPNDVEEKPDVSFHDPPPVRIAFMGRLHPVKGCDILLKALATLPPAALKLDLYGIRQGGEDYVQELEHLADGDARIRFCDPVPSADVVATLSTYDLLAVPSQWLETGPLVVYEAFAAGIPVVGSNLGGIAELVTDGVDGVLVEPDDLQAWHKALDRIACQPLLVEELRAGIRLPRTMQDAAKDTLEIYHNSKSKSST